MTFARIGIFEVPPHQLPEVVELFRDRVTPKFATHEGFLGYQAFSDVRTGHYIGISFWNSLAALEGSNTAAKVAREAAANLGARAVREPFIAREEFDTRPVCGQS